MVNQLAAAHERGAIGKGSVVKVSATSSGTSETPLIKLAVKKQGVRDFVDIDHTYYPIQNKRSFF